MNWITLSNGDSLNMELVARVRWWADEGGRAVDIYLGGGFLYTIQDKESIEQLEEWMIDNSAVLE